MRRRLIVAAALLLALPALPIAQENENEDDAGFLERQIQNRLSSEGRDVTIRGFRGALSGEAQVARIAISDADGVWLLIEDAVLDWNRTALLRGRLEVNEISAGRISIARPPLPSNDLPAPEASGPFQLPDLPVSVNIEDISADRVELGEDLFNLGAVVSVDGSIRLADGEGEANLDIVRIDDKAGEFTLDASYANASDVLSLNLVVDEGPDGIAARLMNLPGRPPLRLAVQGEDPLSDFTANVQLATDGEDRLAGAVTTSVEDGTRAFAADLQGDVAPVFAPAYQPFFGPDVALQVQGRTSPEGGTSISDLSLTASALTLQGQVEIGADGLPDLIDLTGRIAGADGQPVVLPLSGAETRVDDVSLDIGFDASQGEDWTADITVAGLDRAGVTAERIALDGTGVISGEGEGQRVTADFDFEAANLDLADQDAGDALGQTVSGNASIAWQSGQPIAVDALTVNGETYALDASGTIDLTQNLLVDAEATVTAEDLSAFSGLAGRDLGGSVQLDLDAETALAAGTFDVTATGTATDLAVDEPRADAVLAGEADLTLDARRDESGTFVDAFRIESPNARIEGAAQLTSLASQIDLTAELDDASLVADGIEGPASATIGAAKAQGPWGWGVDVTAAGAAVNATGTADDLTDVPLITADATVAAPDISVFSALAGRDLEGSVDLTLDTRLRTDLSEVVIRADGRASDISAGIDGLREALAGDIELSVDASRDGDRAVIRVLQLTGPGLNVDVTGEATGLTTEAAVTIDGTVDVDDLQRFATLAGRDLSGSAALTLDARANQDFTVVDGTAEGSLSDLAIGMEGIDDALAGEITLSLDGSRNGDAATIRRAVVQGPDFSLDATGSATDLDGDPQVTLDGDLQATDLSRFAALAQRDLSGAVTLSVDGTASADLTVLDLTASGEAQGVTTGMDAIDRAIAGTIAFDLDADTEGETVVLNRLSLTGPDFSVTGSGQAEDVRTTPVVTLDADVTAGDLSRFAGLAGRDLSGSAELSVDGTAATDLSRLDATATGRMEDVTVGIEGVDEALAGVVTLNADAERQGEVVVLNRLDAAGPDWRIAGTGQAEGLDTTPVVTLDAEVSADDLSRFSTLAQRELSGSADLTVDGTASLDYRTLDVTAEGRVTDLSAGLGDAEELLSGETRLTLDAARDGDSATIRRLSIDGDAVTLNATGSATGLDTTPVVTLDASADVPDLARFAGLAGRPLDGSASLNAEGTVAADLSTFDVTADGRAVDIVTGIPQADALLDGATTFAVDADRTAEGITIDALRVDGRILDLTATGGTTDAQSEIRADLSISDASALFPGLPGDLTATVAADRDGEVWSYDVQGDASGIDIDATGTVENLSDLPFITTDAALSVDRLAPFSDLAGMPLAGSVDLDVEGELTTDLTTLDLTVDGTTRDVSIGQAQADLLLRGVTEIALSAERDGDTIAVERLNVSNPALRLTADGSLTEGGGAIDFDARLADVSPFAPDFPGAATLTGTVSRQGQDGALTLDVDGTGPGGLTLAADGTVDPAGPTANLDVTGQLPLAAANAFIAPQSIAGTLNANLAVNGPLALSSVSGTLSSNGARLVAPALGIGVSGIALRGDLGGGSLNLSVEGAVDEGGRIRVAGPIGLSAPFPADLDVTLSNAALRDERLYETSVDGTVAIDGPLTGGATIGGRIVVGETEIRVPSGSLGGAAPLPDVRHVRPAPRVVATLRRADLLGQSGGDGAGGGGGPAYPLNLSIVAPNQIFIRGRGLDAELGGSVQLTGTTADVVPAGQFELIRGRLDLLGQRFDLTDGTVTLQGDFTPVIRLVAETDRAETVILIIVEGPANDPQIRFESQPGLPDDEVLARLIFGRGLDSLSPLQAAQLAAAVQTLRGGGDGFLGAIREGTGLADLDVTSTDEGNTAVRAGAYLSDNIYSDVTVDSAGEAQIELNLDVTNDVTVRGSVSNSGETGVGIFYEQDY